MKKNCKNCGLSIDENNKVLTCPICKKEEFCELCGCHCEKCGTITCENCNTEYEDDYFCVVCADITKASFNSSIDNQIKELKKTIKLLEKFKK